jgi:hypothetical protein
MAGSLQYILFLVFHGKSTTFLKQLVKKIPEITEVEHKIGKCIGKSIEKNLLLRNHQTHWNDQYSTSRVLVLVLPKFGSI